jgi:hypothetical protein
VRDGCITQHLYHFVLLVSCQGKCDVLSSELCMYWKRNRWRRINVGWCFIKYFVSWPESPLDK